MININRHYDNTDFITGLRFIAVLGVFLIHSGGGGLREYGTLGNLLVDMGKYGVDMFFVISGFTIFNQLYNNKYSYEKFLKLRLLRLIIPYFPLLLLSYILNFETIEFSTFLGHSLFLGYLIPEQKSVIGVEWSLSVEVFYYFVIGFLISKFKPSIRDTILITLILYIVSKTFGKIFNIHDLLYFVLPLKYAYMFVLGGYAYLVRQAFLTYKHNQFLQNISNTLMIFVLGIWILNLVFNKAIFDSLTYALLTCLCLIFIQDNAKFSRLLTNKYIVFLGSISFSIYLIHPFILGLNLYRVLAIKDITFVFFVNLFFTLTISTIYYYIFEYSFYKKLKFKLIGYHK